MPVLDLELRQEVLEGFSSERLLGELNRRGHRLHSGLSFNELREANLKRIPLFKNCHGQPAHTEPDGSDWTPADWAQAVSGEFGEYCNERKKFQRGDISKKVFTVKASKELADVVTYLDILAYQLGISLGDAVIDKFNEVSKRVGAEVYL